MGFFFLFLHSDTGRAHLEVCDVGLYPTYDCGCRSGLPEEILVGRNYYSAVHRPSDSVESHSDELLFHVCDPVFVGAYFEDAYKKKELPHFFKASAILALAAVVGVCINISNLYHTYEYSKETMRGKSELKQEGAAASQVSSGLDRDYITNWSYGIGETLTLLVPNVKGGGSGATMSQSEVAMAKANPMYSGIYSQFPRQYFGEQPWTAGPVYVGAFVMFLFVLGCFIVKGPLKWALLGATIFSILLSWGKNFMGLTDFFIDYVPMYNKFRAVSSILVIAEFTIPLLAILP